jgi:hypothetical protein
VSRWRTEADGALAIRCDFLDRQILLQMHPEVFFLTEGCGRACLGLVAPDRFVSERQAMLKKIKTSG